MFINEIKKAGGGGVQREYIFKDGVFSIQPTSNNFTNQGGKLINGNLLSIPYEFTGKMIFIKLIPKIEVSWFKFQSTVQPNTTSYDTQAELYITSLGGNQYGINKEFIFSIPSNKLIGIGGTANKFGYEVLEIWTEDIYV